MNVIYLSEMSKVKVKSYELMTARVEEAEVRLHRALVANSTPTQPQRNILPHAHSLLYAPLCMPLGNIFTPVQRTIWGISVSVGQTHKRLLCCYGGSFPVVST